MPFELNCGYYPQVFYKEDVNSRFRPKAADKLTKEFRNLIAACRKNLQHAQKLQKRAYNKVTKPKSWAPGEKIWLNSKYIKTKCNRKLEAKFFGPFRVLHSVDSQAYKLELPKQWMIHDVFYICLLEQDITRKGRVDKKIVEKMEFEAGSNNEEYDIEGICDSAVYARKLEASQLLGLYYLIFWKGYPKDKST